MLTSKKESWTVWTLALLKTVVTQRAIVDLITALCGVRWLNSTWSFSHSGVQSYDLFKYYFKKKITQPLKTEKLMHFLPSPYFSHSNLPSHDLYQLIREGKVKSSNKRNLFEKSLFMATLCRSDKTVSMSQIKIFWLLWICIKNTCH